MIDKTLPGCSTFYYYDIDSYPDETVDQCDVPVA